MIYKKLLFILLIFLSSCQLAPTKVVETVDQPLAKNESIYINSNTIVIDTRTFYEYSTFHLPQSVSVQWTDFVNPQNLPLGILKKDLEDDARRLARKGVGPNKLIVVVDKGTSGNGEGGRVVWTLLVMGLPIQKIRLASIDYFKNRWTTRQIGVLPSEAYWPIQTQSHWFSSKEENRIVKKFLNEKGEKSEVNSGPDSNNNSDSDSAKKINLDTNSGRSKESIYVIDVRPSRSENQKSTELGIYYLQKNWKLFFNKLGRPQQDIVNYLTKNHIGRKTRILVLSQRGLQSGAVVGALALLGYENVGNIEGGIGGL